MNTPRITRESLKKSLELAKDATPGPWYSHFCFAGTRNECWCNVVGTSPDPKHENMDKVIGQGSANVADAAHIAHNNPEFITALVQAHLEALQVLEYYANDPVFKESSYIAVSSNFRSGDAARSFLSKHGGVE